MATYRFTLVKSIVPVVRGRNIITDSNVGGTKNTYKIYRCAQLVFLPNWLTDVYLGKKIFLRPYQYVWPKGREHRMHAAYWGKGPLLNMWLVLSNDYERYDDLKVLLPEADTKSHCTKIFGKDFLSQELVKNLKSNKSFYQSNL
jgi:hypothetical protein